ncbi:cell cycle transcriptional repressor whi5 [Cladorrhinum sp. PSN332]|nr:cell cycle transcriptional repressor whi5 [Cladorrhinum sp. PSN332]
MDLDPTPIPPPPRVDPERVEDKDPQTVPLSARNGSVSAIHGKMHHETAVPSTWTNGGHETRQFAPQGAPPLRDNSPSTNNETRRDQEMGESAVESQAPAVQSAPISPKAHTTQRHPLLSRSNSQGTSSTNETDRVFTPPANGGRLSPNNGSTQHSSQESQLLQLSQIAAAQERIPENPVVANGNGASSRKRMADGAVKHGRSNSIASPALPQVSGHSRNTSTVSVTSTVGSRVGELSAELRARLSYAMVKVNRGWQSHSIDQVETLASQAASPTSSTSTIHLRNGSSASPQLSSASHRDSNNTTPTTGPQPQLSGRTGGDQAGRVSPTTGSRTGSVSPVKPISSSLAPPVAIQTSHTSVHPRRHSNPRPVPALLSASLHSSSYPGPGSPGHPNGFLAAHHRASLADAMGLSHHQNNAEKDAIESLLFMSSPGNSANLKHAFPTSSQPLPSGHTAPQRTALPSARKSLPTARPVHGRSQSGVQKRVGFERSPMEIDIDEPYGSPASRGTPRRRMNGGHAESHATVTRLKPIPASTGLSVPSKPRPALADDELDRMLDRAAAESDSEGEIEIPLRTARRDGA